MGADEAVSRAAALRFATINAAYADFVDRDRGSIETGKLADFVVLSGDYLTVPDAGLLRLHVLQTYVGGRIVYKASKSGA